MMTAGEGRFRDLLMNWGSALTGFSKAECCTKVAALISSVEIFNSGLSAWIKITTGASPLYARS